MQSGGAYPREYTDFYCEGYRWFDNYNDECERYQSMQNKTDKGFYGGQVIVFEDITELNAIIHRLTLLRDSINQNQSKATNIHKEFGNNEVYCVTPYPVHSPQTYPPRKEI